MVLYVLTVSVYAYRGAPKSLPRANYKRLAMDNLVEKKAKSDETQTFTTNNSILDQLYIHSYNLNVKDELINAVKISPDKTLLATCSSLGKIRIYDIKNGEPVTVLVGHSKGISDIAFSPIDSNTIASCSDDMTIRLWSISKKKSIKVLRKHTYHVTTIKFNLKGNLLISGAADESIVIWDLSSGKSLKTLAAHSDPVSCVCLTPDDTIIISASYDGLMRLFDTETGQCLKTLVYNSSSHGTATASTNDVVNFPISVVNVTPNGKYILSSSLDGKIRLWDYMNNKVVKTYTGIDNSLINSKYNGGTCFVTCTREPIVVSGSETSGALFWNVQTKNIVFQLQPGATVLDVAVCGDGELLAVSTLQGDVDVYHINSKYLQGNGNDTLIPLH